MQIKLDLHIHSHFSLDGRESPEAILRRAKKLGLQGVAICDHDRLFSDRPETGGVLLIPGEEFSTEYGHLLGLFLKEPVRPGSFEEIVAGIHAQDGLAVLAHPFEHSADAGRIEPIAHLLDGVETWNGRANRKNPRANEMAAAFAEKHGLPGTGGSDAHLLEEIGNGTVTVEAASLTEEAVRAALLRRGNAVSGVNGRAVCVARSQFTRRRKTHAGLLSYGKWMLFAAKCCLHDIRSSGRKKTCR